MARDRPSPYGEGMAFFIVARGPRMPYAQPSGFPPRSLDCADAGEGQVFPPPYDEGAFCRPIASRPGGLSYRGNGSVRGITKPFKSCYSELKIVLTEENCILLEKI